MDTVKEKNVAKEKTVTKEKKVPKEKWIYLKKDTAPPSREEEKRNAIEERWLRAKRSSTEQSIMDASYKPAKKKSLNSNTNKTL